MPFEPRCLATAVGPLPNKGPEAAVERILELFPELPFWPQFPKSGVLEEAHVQFSEGLPGFVMKPAERKGHFETSADAGERLASFRARVRDADWNYFALSPEYAPGFHALAAALGRIRAGKPAAVKGQITGPLSFGLENTDEEGMPIIENGEFFGAVVQGLAMKARWQVRELRKLHGAALLFINEPAFDAALAEQDADHAIQALDEVIEGIHAEGGIAGIHVPGECDWSLAMDTKADILGFNAFDYGQLFAENQDLIGEYLEKGKSIGWGIVPATSRIMEEDAESLTPMFEEILESLESGGMDKKSVLDRSLILASDGCEMLSERESNKVLFVLHDLSATLRKKYYGA